MEQNKTRKKMDSLLVEESNLLDMSAYAPKEYTFSEEEQTKPEKTVKQEPKAERKVKARKEKAVSSEGKKYALVRIPQETQTILKLCHSIISCNNGDVPNLADMLGELAMTGIKKMYPEEFEKVIQLTKKNR